MADSLGGPLNPLVVPVPHRYEKHKPVPELPRDLRKELATFARKLSRDHRTLFGKRPVSTV